MKKNLIILLSFATFLLSGCLDSGGQITKIEGGDIASTQQTFNSQLDETQYIQDLEDFLSYNVLSIKENKPFTSDFSFSVKFDENSAIQGGVDFSQEKFSKSHDLESADITLDINAETKDSDAEPFGLHGSITLLYKDNEMYANLHKLDVSMGEGNMVAKMYTLLGDLLVNNWVNLEVHSGGFITLDEEENDRLVYIVGSVKNLLKSEDAQGGAELINSINSYIDLGISTDELQLTNQEVSYFELGDKSIQKLFTGSFEGKDSSFDMSLDVSKKGVKIHLYNIENYGESALDLEGRDFIFSLQEIGKSEYSVSFQSLKDGKVMIDLQGKLKYNDTLTFSADFVSEPLDITDGQKISGEIEGSLVKKSGESDKEIPEITGDILSFSELLSSL